MHKFLKLAFEEARAHPFDRTMDYNLCAVFVRGGKILSIGYNNRDWNPITEHYKVADHCCTTHAEVDGILKKRRKIRFEDSKVFVVRIRSDGSVGDAKPCEMCQDVLYNYGVKKAIFTTSEFPFMDSIRLKKRKEK